jgi:hypothetical protein
MELTSNPQNAHARGSASQKVVCKNVVEPQKVVCKNVLKPQKVVCKNVKNVV